MENKSSGNSSRSISRLNALEAIVEHNGDDDMKASSGNSLNMFVESEFAPLRTVVLAQSEIAMPKGVFSNKDAAFLSEDSYVNKLEGKNFGVAFPQKQAAWEREREAFGAVLRKHGVEVLRPRKLTETEKTDAGDNGYSNYFARDPFFTIGNHVVEGAVRFRFRKKEILPIRDLIESRIYSSSSVYVAAPQPAVAEPFAQTFDLGPAIEGGDVLVLGKKVFVGNSGLASNTQGIKWLKKLLMPYDYDVQEVRLHPKILHLDCAMGLIRNGLMVMCPEAFPDGVPQEFNQWDKISVSLTEAGQLAANGLPISPEVYVTDPAFSHIGNQLEQRGINVEYVDYQISRSFGGAFRCSTQALLRH